MSIRSVLPILAVLFSLTGCVNLKPVQNYASESAKFSAYTELTDRYRDTYRREQPYLDASLDKGEKATDAVRQATYEDLLRIQQGITAYMETLATLAGEDTFSLSKDVTTLAGTIKQVPNLGLKAEQVDAYANVVQVITRWATSAKQERAVRQMVTEGDPHLQVLLKAMGDLVEIYRKTHESERKRVLGVFEVGILFTDDPKDVLLNRLARAHQQAKAEEYRQADLKYEKAAKALAAMAEGHRKLRESLSDLSREDLKQALSQAAKDIKTIRESLKLGGA